MAGAKLMSMPLGHIRIAFAALTLVACQTVVTPSSPSANPPQLTTTSTTLATRNRSTQSEILFERQGSTWAVSSDGTNERMLVDGYFPYAWSPSGQQLLIGRDKGVYIAHADGSRFRLIYHNDKDYKIGPRTGWLDDNRILVEAWSSESAPHIYVIDASTSQILTIDQTKRVIEAIAPNGKEWIQFTGKGFEWASLEGDHSAILGNFQGIRRSVASLDANIVFLSSGDKLAFAGCQNQECNIYRAYKHGNSLDLITDVVFNLKDLGLQGLSASPTSTRIAFIYRETLYIIDAVSSSIEYQWPWDASTRTSRFIWSPDSDAIVFQSMNASTSHYDLSILEIGTGKTKQITKGISSAHDNIYDWKYIQIGN